MEWNVSPPIASIFSKKIITIDKTKHIKDWIFLKYLKIINNCFTGNYPEFEIDKPKNEIISERMESVDSYYEEKNIFYNAPSDARKINLDSGSIDFIYSFAVLEHIPKNILDQILSEFFRVLKPDGIMFHVVEPEDHNFQYGSSKVEFLRYSNFFYNYFYNSSISYHNRLRDSEYKNMFKNNKFEVFWYDRELSQDDVDILNTMNLNDVYKSFSIEDLAISKVTYILKKNKGNPKIENKADGPKWFSE